MEKILKKLSSANSNIIMEGIQEITEFVKTGIDSDDISIVFDALTSLYYMDTFGRKELTAAVELAQKTTASLGPVIIPLIIEKIHDTDIRSELLFAQTCGLMGPSAINPLLEIFSDKHSSVDTAFALYAFGKIKSPEIQTALPIILEEIKSPKKETEDTAVRALGKICESMDPAKLSEDEKEKIFNTFLRKSQHSNQVIRSKVIRGFGKFIRYHFSDDIQKNEIRNIVQNVLGLGDEGDRDPSYLVRREAQEVLDTLF